MRMLFALFITLPLIFNLTIEPGFAQSNNFQTIFQELSQNLEDFNSKTEEEKDKFLKELDNSISDLNEKIKTYISEKKEKPYEKIIDLMKKIIEINYFMKIKVCNVENKNYENCINEKKNFMNNLLTSVQDNFGQCSVTIDYIIKLTNNAYSNFEFLRILITTIADNNDFIEKNKIDIISKILDCL